MPRKIKQITIPIIITYLLLISSFFSSTAQRIIYSSYLPLVSHDLSAWLGPYGGSITSIVINPTNPDVAYAGSWGSGIFKTLDGGQKWQSINLGLGNLYINSLAMDPRHHATLYAGTYKNQLYKSTNGGNSWVWSGTGMQDQAIVYSIAVNPINPDLVYAATRGISNNGNPPWNGVVYRSANAGLTWTPVLTNVGGEEAQDWIYSLVIDPNESNKVFAASHEHGPFYSPNNGVTWYPIARGIRDYSGRAIIIDPKYLDDTLLYYGVWHEDAVYRSLNSGSDWTPVNSGILYAKVYSMALDPVDTDTVYLATFNRGVLKSLDRGYHWLNAGLQDDRIYNLAVNPIHSSTMYAGTAGDGLYKSKNYGDVWQSVNSGIENANSTSILISPSDPNKLFTSNYGAGVYVSTNRGQSWSALNAGLQDKYIHALVQDPDHPGVIYALTDSTGLFQNNLDSGSGWVRIAQGLPLARQAGPAYPQNHPFATLEMLEMSSHPDLDSPIASLANPSLLSMTFAPSNPNIAYLGMAGEGVYKSTDGGQSWSPAGLSGESVPGLAVDPLDPGLVYAATTTPGSLKVSQDGGGSWSDASLPVTFYSLATTATKPGFLFAGTSSGIYIYEAGNWTPLALADQLITCIKIDPLQPDRLFVGTDNNGAFYSLDGGLTWQVVDHNLNNLTIQAINLDPAYPNFIYFASKTHGIFLATKFP